MMHLFGSLHAAQVFIDSRCSSASCMGWVGVKDDCAACKGDANEHSSDDGNEIPEHNLNCEIALGAAIHNKLRECRVRRVTETSTTLQEFHFIPFPIYEQILISNYTFLV